MLLLAVGSVLRCLGILRGLRTLDLRLQLLDFLLHLPILPHQFLKLLGGDFLPPLLLFLPLELGQMLSDVLGVYPLLLEIQQIFEILDLSLQLVNSVGVVAVELRGLHLKRDMVCTLDKFQCANRLVHILGRGR